MGSFALVAVNADRMLGDLESENSFLAYVQDDYTKAQCDQLQKKIEALPNVAKVTFITKQEAKDAYLEGKEDVELYADLPVETFRDRFSIHVADIELFEQTVNQVTALQGIANHRAETQIAEGFVMVRNIATALASILVVILVVISAFIIANTTRLATFTRREEIAIMKMCGATNSFVRWPFIVEGLILGLVGAMVAFFCLWAVYAVVENALATYGAETFLTILPFKSVVGTVIKWFAGAGCLIGAGGSALAIRKFLQV
jgi:cell division transport system permease protein